jgi:hypothetical protein
MEPHWKANCCPHMPKARNCISLGWRASCVFVACEDVLTYIPPTPFAVSTSNGRQYVESILSCRDHCAIGWCSARPHAMLFGFWGFGYNKRQFKEAEIQNGWYDAIVFHNPRVFPAFAWLRSQPRSRRVSETEVSLTPPPFQGMK